MSRESQWICGEYKIIKMIGHGSFGEIYEAVHRSTGEHYAVKIEKPDIRVPQLRREASIYKRLRGGDHIPKMYYFGEDDDDTVLVMQLLGPSLEGQFRKNGYRLSLKTVMMLACQMLSCIEYMHLKNFIHRDIKPDNFLVGYGKDCKQIYIIDYGLSKPYMENGRHIPFISGKSFAGTARYGSINALEGCLQSRRDDLEAIGYVLIYLVKGTLPWIGLNADTTSRKHRLIAKSKRNHSLEELCSGLPRAFIKYMTYVRNLEYEETPDYDYLRCLFDDALLEEGYTNDNVFDWVKDDLSFPRIPAIEKPKIRYAQPKDIDPLDLVPKDDERHRKHHHHHHHHHRRYHHRHHHSYSSEESSPSSYDRRKKKQSPEEERRAAIEMFLRRRGVAYQSDYRRDRRY